jgi:hypothetical protein
LNANDESEAIANLRKKFELQNQTIELLTDTSASLCQQFCSKNTSQADLDDMNLDFLNAALTSSHRRAPLAKLGTVETAQTGTRSRAREW